MEDKETMVAAYDRNETQQVRVFVATFKGHFQRQMVHPHSQLLVQRRRQRLAVWQRHNTAL